MAEVHPEEPQLNGTTHHHDDTGHQRQESSSQSLKRRGSIDRDAQEMVIESLRAQIQDLFSQVSQLNNKLVKSYDRVSDLEDDLHVASANVRTSSLKISQLELERTQHLAALNTGLLVEKSHVTAELGRLMERATEEAAQRGQAESARIAIEKDLDDLSASLFDQANSMVAEARYDKHLSEKKVESAEQALKSAEEAIQLMQIQMQALQAEREDAEKKTREMEMTMGKGKWIARRDSHVSTSLRLLNCHGPYQDFMAFIAHLRVLHPTSPVNTPAMSTLLQLPFLARLLTEDSEPTVRLDLAPSLNWLSRRSVLSAIHSGQLIIEPLSVGTLFAESATQPASVAGVNSSNDNISCALCGVSIFPASEPQHSPRPPVHPLSHVSHGQNQVPSSTWSGSFFKRPLSTGNPPHSPTHSIQRSLSSHSDSQIFVFRLAPTSTTGSTIASSLPIPSLARSTSQSGSAPIPIVTSQSYGGSGTNQTSSPNNQPTTLYPLCMSGWCLNRLRTTCTMWAFVRTGIVDKVWEEELPPPPAPPTPLHVEKSGNGEKPPIPPRKRGIWGIASAIGERAASWGDSSDKDKAKKSAAETPAHSEQRRLPPPLPPVNPSRASHPLPPPPPLPRRNEGRGRSANNTPQPKVDESAVDNSNTNGTLTSSTSAPAAVPISASAEGEPAAPVESNSSTQVISMPPLSEVSSAVVAPLSPIRRSHIRNASAGTPPPPLPARAVRSPPPPPPAAAAPTSDSRPATPAAGEPSRTASPAVAINGGTAPAPPPIPRRAAARARGPAGGSRPSTPANADSSPAADSVVVDKTSDTTVDEASSTEKAVEEPSKKADAEPDTAELKPSATATDDLTPVAHDGVDSVPDQDAESNTVAASKSEDSYKTVEEEESTSSVANEDEGKEKLALPNQLSDVSPSSSEVFVDALSPGQEVENPTNGTGDATADEAKVAAVAEKESQVEVAKDAPVDDYDQATIAAPQTPVAGKQHVDLAETTLNAVANDADDNSEAPLDKDEVHLDPIVNVNGIVQPNGIADPSDEEKTHDKHDMVTAEEKAEEERRRKEQEEKDRARFVGDTTWEERTWKEVVRLREDMFWARIGGIRD